MPITVKFYTHDEQLQLVEAGELSWDGKGSIRVVSGELAAVIAKPIRVQQGEEVSPTKEPERFLRSLHIAYRNAYLTAMPAEGTTT